MNGPPDRGSDTGEARALRFRSLWVFFGVGLVAAVVVASLVPEPPEIPGDPGNYSGHLIAYGSMMGWFARLYPSLRARVGWAVGFAALGIALEFVQQQTGYRTYSELDMLANTLGVGAGWAASPPRLPDGIAAADRWLAGFIDAR